MSSHALSLAAVPLAVCSAACDGPRAPAPAGPTEPTATSAAASAAAGASETRGGASDVLTTSAGPVSFHPVYHASLWLEVTGHVVWIDPWSQGKLDGPKADVVLLTDIHPDHLDNAAIDRVRKPDSIVLGPQAVADKRSGVTVLSNGDTRDLGFMKVVAVPMYNLTRGPTPGTVFHEKGRGNGYVLEIGDRRIYLSGDTECTPEVKALQSIDVAFLCMNLPYTMPPSEAAECVRAFRPKVVYPYHYRETNLDELTAALEGSGVEVRRRDWY